MSNRATYQFTPRGMLLRDAAEYCCLSQQCYQEKVKQGALPGATLPGGRVDKALLDKKLDEWSNLSSNPDQYEAWKSANTS